MPSKKPAAKSKKPKKPPVPKLQSIRVPLDDKIANAVEDLAVDVSKRMIKHLFDVMLQKVEKETKT